jgi:RNA polymerase sigma-70 factor (ECF subfamily)
MASAPDTTSLSLLARLRANQPTAWERLVELYAPLVYHWCRRCGLGPEDTADVFQDVFRSVYQHIGAFRREQGDSFRGWLRTITRNKVRDHFRRVQGQPQAPGGTDAQRRLQDVPEPDLSEADPAEADLLHRQLHAALEHIRGEFTERTWRAFWQVQMEGRATEEVGAALGLTPAAVRKAKFRVLRRLREELGELLE